MKRLGLNTALIRILLISVPFSCGPQTFLESAPSPRCGSDRVLPLPPSWSQPVMDGGSRVDGGGKSDAGTGPSSGLSDAECAAICGDTMTCETALADGGVPGVRCVMQCYGVGCGRRPAELPALAAENSNPLARYFEQAAYLESASVHAFQRLATELRAHEAPEPLIRAAERAVDDELRHAKVMSGLARRYGGTPRPVPKGPLHIRPLAEVALENMAEGCVRETYGALIAWVQTAAAGDPRVKRLLRPIASDETAHARLAWSVAHWCHTQLAQAERRAIADAQVSAVAQLTEEAEVEPPPALVQIAGLPTRAVARRLVSEAQRTLWS